MSAYESSLSEHWVANLSNLPDDARGYFACFALIRNAWDSCTNGAWLLRLALEMAPDESSREEVRRIAGDINREIASQVEPHFADRKLKEDPIRVAYDDARSELGIAVAPIDKPWAETAVAEENRATYERSLRVLRRLSADLVRSRMSVPAGLRPDPAFEDTKAIPPVMIPELARIRMDPDSSVPSVPSTQPGAPLSPGGVPRPTVPRPTGPGGARSR